MQGDKGALEISSFENLIARYGITRREREIIKEVCSGKSNQEIADALFISLQTVKDHTHRIYLKMDIKSRVQLIKVMQIK
jgi:DNA-binding CsgD family transcriptional regulator